MNNPKKINKSAAIKLIFIIIIGTCLRFSNLNWDQGYGFHPDEPYITKAVKNLRIPSQLNPNFYIYGSVPMYVIRVSCQILELASPASWCQSSALIAVIGRVLSAFFSVGSIFMAYIVGKIYFSSFAGILAALLLAFSPWAIKEAHYATVDTLMGFWLLFLLLAVKKYFDKPVINNLIFMGVITGLAIGTKPTSYLYIIIPLSAIFLSIIHDSKFTFRLLKDRNLYKSTGILLITIIFIFALVSPFTLIHAKTSWLTIMGTVADIIGRHPDTPFTFQFIGTVPYLYQLKTMTWQSAVIALLGFYALIKLLIAGATTNRKDYLLFVVFPLLYFLSSGVWLVKFVRYNIPFLLPATIAASWILTPMYKSRRLFSLILIVITLITTVIWGLSNWSIYLKPQTRIIASEWIYQNIPPGSVLLQEGPYENLPLPLPNTNPGIYNYEIVNEIYAQDTENKIASFSGQLEKGDYFIFVTSRQWKTLPRLTTRYPLTSKFYSNLISGRLGYREVARFSSYPNFFGFEINDDNSEETNRIFDHSLVRIFKKNTIKNRLTHSLRAR